MRPLERETIGPRLFTRADALALLKIGETTLYWLQRTGKLKPVRIGSRVLFNATEIERLATHGASLTEAEKEAAAKHHQEAPPTPKKANAGNRGRPRKQRSVEMEADGP
jgi:Helix-turn-helix domain